jgi:glutathione synthase/RimK-type ligase-like ATP-grasp enzyme
MMMMRMKKGFRFYRSIVVFFLAVGLLKRHTNAATNKVSRVLKRREPTNDTSTHEKVPRRSRRESSTSLCEIWSQQTTPKQWDMIAVTDDTNYGEGRGEDMALIRAMRRLGHRATRISIQDYDFDWNTTKMVVIRSAWNKYYYIEDYWRFLHEMDQSTILVNPLDVILWQADKANYLRQLHEAGINIPRTVHIGPDQVDLDDKEGPTEEDMKKIQRELGCTDIIMKPQSGNGGIGVRLYPDEEDTLDQFFVIVWEGEEVALFQCYQERIETNGERGIVFVGGEVSHGILKMPRQDSYMVNTDFGGTWSIYDPTPQEVDFAKNVANKIYEIAGKMPAYLRVDVIDDNDGNLALMELAAGTANLYLERRPQAAEFLALYLDQLLREQEEECQKHTKASSTVSDEL